jgi:hypothetical protein
MTNAAYWFNYSLSHKKYIGERHLSELTEQKSEIKQTKEWNKTDIRVTTCNPFERKFNNPYEWE